MAVARAQSGAQLRSIVLFSGHPAPHRSYVHQCLKFPHRTHPLRRPSFPSSDRNACRAVRSSYGGPSQPQPPPSPQYYYNPNSPSDNVPEAANREEAARRAQASKRVERTSRYFRRLGFLGFWGQLICSTVAAVILVFSIIITGKPTAPVSAYLTFGGIVAGFISVFWSYGYLQTAERLKVAVANPMKAPPRAAVVSNLKNGLIINLLGLGATLLGLQATVGVLVAKSLTSSMPMYGAVGTPPGFSPVLALDVFLVQACGNTALSHFVGLVLALELLRSTTQSQPPPEATIPKPA